MTRLSQPRRRDASAQPPYPPEWGEPHTKTVTWFWPEGLRRTLVGKSGLEVLQGMLDGRYPPPPIAGIAESRLVSVAHGEALFSCRPDQSFLNPGGTVHGGLLCTLMDSAIGCAVMTTTNPITFFATIELKVSFFSPMPLDGGEISVHGRTQRVGRRVAFAEAHAHDADGNLLGHATSSLTAIPSAR